jgi:hypothetical protein
MKKLTFAALLAWLAFAPAAFAANVNIDGLPAAASVTGANLFECEQSGTNRQCTAAQMAAYVYGLTSADATISGTGAVTFATVNANVGSFGNATNCVSFTTNAKGLITAASQTTCTPAIASVTGLGTGVASALAAAMNSSTGMIGALTPTNNNCVVGNGTAWTSASCPGGAGNAIQPVSGVSSTVAGMTAGSAVADTDLFYASQSSGTNDRKVTGAQVKTYAVTSAVRATTTTSEALANSDQGKLVTFSNASAVACTIAQAGGGGNFAAGWAVSLKNLGAGTVTCTPTTSTVDGAATFILLPGQGLDLYSDGTNYFTQGGRGTIVAKGTLALATSAISSAACTSAQTLTATGVTTTDIVLASFNGDPTAVTGYVPLTAGMLTIIVYPTANTINVKVCNNTSASITPGAITLNLSAVR